MRTSCGFQTFYSPCSSLERKETPWGCSGGVFMLTRSLLQSPWHPRLSWIMMSSVLEQVVEEEPLPQYYACWFLHYLAYIFFLPYCPYITFKLYKIIVVLQIKKAHLEWCVAWEWSTWYSVLPDSNNLWSFFRSLPHPLPANGCIWRGSTLLHGAGSGAVPPHRRHLHMETYLPDIQR